MISPEIKGRINPLIQKLNEKIIQIDPFLDDEFNRLKPNPFPREKQKNNIRNYDYLNIPSEFSPYRIRLPKINNPRIKQKVPSFSEKIFPEIYGKKDVVYDNFSRMYVSDTRSVDSKRLILNPMLTKLLMTDIMKRKTIKPVQNFVSGRSSASSDIGEELRVEILDMKNVENLYEKNEESKRTTERQSPGKKKTNSSTKIKKVYDHEGEYNKEYIIHNHSVKNIGDNIKFNN